MPYENEHSARLIDPPSEYIRVGRTHGSKDGTVQGVKIPESIDIIWFVVKKDDKEVPIAQALRFPVKDWSETEAKKWLKDKGIKYKSFEPATESDAAHQNMERRCLTAGEMRVEDGDTGKRLVGYAAVFNSLADIGYFKEQIKPGAFAESIGKDDIRALVDHESCLILGRNKASTLRLKEDDKGLLCDIDVPDTMMGRDILVSVGRGDVTGMSFAFRTIQQQWDYGPEDKKEPPIRTLEKVKLFDVSVVTYPAYPDTTVAVRSLRDAGHLKLPESKNTPIDAERLRQLRRKYRHCGRMIARNRPAEVRPVAPPGRGSGTDKGSQ